jgi:uncharacterized protein with PQ loop repeat
MNPIYLSKLAAWSAPAAVMLAGALQWYRVSSYLRNNPGLAEGVFMYLPVIVFFGSALMLSLVLVALSMEARLSGSPTALPFLNAFGCLLLAVVGTQLEHADIGVGSPAWFATVVLLVPGAPLGVLFVIRKRT